MIIQKFKAKTNLTENFLSLKYKLTMALYPVV